MTANLTNSATATGTPPVGPPVTSTDTADVVVIHPAIKIEKGPDSQTISSGGTATFTIKVTNTGDVTLTDVTVTDALAPGCARTKNEIPALASMAPAAVVEYTCTLANVTAGFQNSATATGKPPLGPDVTWTDTASVSIETQPPFVPKADISVTKAATPSVQLPQGGGTAPITYTLVVSNAGPDAADNVKVADAAPVSVSFVSATTTAGTCTTTALALDCTISSLAAGASATITVNATVNATGTKVNVVTVTTTTPETNTGNNSAQAQTVVTAPVTPPTPPAPVKPKPKPAPQICTTVVALPKTLKANGKSQTIKLKVTKGSKGVTGAKIKLSGPGISKTVRTGKNGLVAVSIKPAKPGIIKVEIIGVKACNTQRLGVVGVFEPPVTG